MTHCILVANDDGDVLELPRRMLEQARYPAMPSKCRRQAIEQLDSITPELVITKMVTPKMNVVKMFLKLRDRAPAAGVLMMPVRDRATPESFLEKARLPEASIVLRKPFTRPEMLSAVQQILGPSPVFQNPMQEFL